jgi:hypothetical protein
VIDYLARARLIDTKRGSLVWTDKCVAVTADDRAALYESWFATNAQLLKDHLREVAKTCATALVEQFFNRDLRDAR